MSEPLSTDSYKGVRDFYPEEWTRLVEAFEKIRRTLREFGYEEYMASPLERAELFEAKTSEEIVNEQTYTFEDRGGRKVTLRPEMTPTLARMVAARRRELAFPLRWFSIPNVFRYERPQRGRLREHYQTNIDLLGLSEGEADREVIEIGSAILKSFGAQDTDFKIRINSRKLLTSACEAAGLTGENARAYLRLLDKKEKTDPREYAEAVSKLAKRDPLALLAEGTEPAVQKEKDKLDAFIAALREKGIGNAVYDPVLTRGFDYYTGIVFEIFDSSPENPRSIMGGGRYDNLVALFGGDPIPATGFAFGDVTFMDFLQTHGLLPKAASAPELYLGTPGNNPEPAEKLAVDLRKQGIRVFVNLTDRTLGDQIKDASKRGIPYFAAVGEAEASGTALRLKELVSGTEETLNAKELPDRILKKHA